MYPESAVWLIIVLAFVLASLPFLTERMLAFIPMRLAGEPERLSTYYVLRACLSYGFIYLGAYLMSGEGYTMPLKLLGLGILVICLLLPGYLVSPCAQVKSLSVRLAELILMAILVGSVGFMVEAYFANSVPQTWQFYAISVSIFVILAFPGFVWRHLMRHAPKQ